MSVLPAIPLSAPGWVDGIAWSLAPDAAGLLDPRKLEFSQLRREGRLEQIKHGPHRTVWRIHLDHSTVYCKHCRIGSPRAFLRECLRPPKAKLEFQKARALAALGIPTVRPLAWGVRWRWFPGESFLVTQSLEGAVPLGRFLESAIPAAAPAQGASIRQRLALDLARFIARLHTAGVIHPDLHPANILINWAPGGPSHFYLIDLHAIRIGAPLDHAAAQANLILLNRWFVLRTGRTDRLRFWREYSRLRGFPFDAAVEWESATWQSNLAFWRSRDRRPCGTNRYFRKIQSPVAAGNAVRDLDGGILRQLLADPDAPYRDPGGCLLKDSRSSTVVEVTVPTPSGPRAMIYKRFRVTKWYDPLLNLMRRSPALRSWIAGYGLRERDLPTPRPWLVLHRKRCGLSAEGYLLCDKVPDAQNLRDWVTGLSDLAPEQARIEKWGMLNRVARILREFHRRQLGHRDLKAANILVQLDPGGTPHLSLIDLVGVRVHRRLSDHRRVKDIARLHASFHDSRSVTRADKLRFLRMYLNWALAGSADWKIWWRRIAGATRAKVERNAKRGRPLA